MTDFTNAISQSIYGNGVLIISLIFAFISCFNGYKLFKFLIRIYGFLAIGFIGLLIGAMIGVSSDIMWLMGLGFGILGIFLSYKFYKFMVFVAIAFQAYAVIVTIIPISFVALILSIVAGSLSLMFIKPVIAISTASSGAMILSTNFATLLPITAPFSAIIFIAFAVLGSLSQFKK